MTNERAAQRMHQIFAGQVGPALAIAVGHGTARRVGGLVSAQLLGIALTRYVLRLPAVVELTVDQIVATMTPAIRATLNSGIVR